MEGRCVSLTIVGGLVMFPALLEWGKEAALLSIVGIWAVHLHC